MGGWWATPAVEPAFLYAWLRYGTDLSQASPADALRRSSTPVLLIHGLEDTNIPPEHSQRLNEIRPGNTVLWTVPKAGHTASFGVATEEYERRVLDLFQR